MKFAVAGLVLLSSANAFAAAVPIFPEDGRYTMGVSIDGHPLRFVVDSAATSTFIAKEVAEALNFPVDAAQDGAMVKNYESALFHHDTDTLAMVPRTGMSVADGVVGMDLFAKQRVAYDFDNGMFAAGRSMPAPRGFKTVKVALTADTLAIADVTIDGVKAKALIDSGARRTVGNAKLREALGLKDGDTRLSATDPVPSGKGPIPAMKATAAAIHMGAVTLMEPVITYSEIPFFGAIGLRDEPALLIGIDQFRKLKALAIDYPRKEVQIRQ